LEKEKPPIFGMIERGGNVVIKMLANVRQKTIEPIVKATCCARRFRRISNQTAITRFCEDFLNFPALTSTDFQLRTTLAS